MSRLLRLVLAAPALALLAAVCWLRHRGYVGLSDDDAARTLIAWDFSRAPSLDPTRSSWLPVHTYALGGLLKLAPSLPVVPWVFSLASGLSACALAVGASRALGARSSSAVAVTLALALWRWTVVTAAGSGLPELPSVALLLGALWVLLASPAPTPHDPGEQRRRALRTALAGALLALASGHRYECWMASLGFVLAEAWRSRAAVPALSLTAAASSVPLGWLWLNHARSGHALEFLHRVEAYRHAEGALGSVASRLAVFPLALVRELPAVLALALVALASPTTRARAAHAWLPAAVTLGGLVFTELRGGGATHHATRALLPVAWLLVPLAALGLDRLRDGLASKLALPRRRLLVVGACLLAALVLPGALPSPDARTSVNPEAVSTGRAVGARLARSPGEPWWIELSREDFLWVELASGHPERALPDRVYGAPPPDGPTLLRGLRRCSLAAVSSPLANRACEQSGLHRVATHGAWSVWSR